MKFTLEINCDNAAFDEQIHCEVARILQDAARCLDHAPAMKYVLRDFNGNIVGFAKFTN